MEKTIDTYSMFGKEIKNTKTQWVDRWKDCTVKSLMGLMTMEEYKNLEFTQDLVNGYGITRSVEDGYVYLQRIKESQELYRLRGRTFKGLCRVYRGAGIYSLKEVRIIND